MQQEQHFCLPCGTKNCFASPGKKNLHSQPFRRHATTAPETSTAFPGNIYCQVGRKGSGCRPIWQ